MLDISFTYADLEYFLLILVRVSCFVYVAPFFSMSNVPRRVKISFSILFAYLLYLSVDRNEVVYNTLLGYALIVMKEALTGFLIGWGRRYARRSLPLREASRTWRSVCPWSP